MVLCVSAETLQPVAPSFPKAAEVSFIFILGRLVPTPKWGYDVQMGQEIKHGRRQPTAPLKSLANTGLFPSRARQWGLSVRFGADGCEIVATTRLQAPVQNADGSEDRLGQG